MTAIAAAQNAGTIDRIKEAAGNAAQSTKDGVYWAGRQVKVGLDAIWGFLVRIAEAVKPAFARIAKFGVESFESTKEVLSSNKEITMGLAIGALVATLLGGLYHHMYGK